MDIREIPISKIKPAPYNPRVDLKPGQPEYEKIKRSIKEFGYADPIIWNEVTGHIVGGHQRFKVLKEMKHTKVMVSVVRIKDLRREKAFNMALNKAQGRFDDIKVEALLRELNTGDFDVTLSAFSESDVHRLLGTMGRTGATDPDAAPPKLAKPISKRGDVWTLGAHRIMCGDCTKPADVGRLFGGDLFKNEQAVLVNTDPPYGVNYVEVAAATRGAGKSRAIANDDLQGTKLQAFLEATLTAAWPHLREDTAFYLWHPMLTEGKFFEAAAAKFDVLIHRQIIWVKPSLIMGRGDYHWRHELCLYGWKTGNRPKWYAGRDQDTVWEIGRENDGVHPTQKPVELFARPIMNHTVKGEIVYEPFSGSGSQIIAAEMSGRRCLAMEIDPGYVDVAIARWEKFTNKMAVRHKQK